MTSIVFTTLFLGLVAGNQTVGVFVEGPAAAVEYRLDGKPIGRVQAPPWELRVDIGTDLSPHELVATALDAEGRPVASAQQWLNLPREVDRLRKAFVALKADLRSQRVVWFEGKHLPQKIELTEQTAGVELLR